MDEACPAPMLTIDVLSAYMLCGAGALAGGGMLRLADSPQPQAASALHMCTVAFLVLGVGLTHIAFASEVGPLNQLGMAVGTLVCLVLIAWGLGRLAGEPVSTPTMTGLLVLAIVVPMAGLAVSQVVLIEAFVVGLALTSLLAVAMVRRFLWQPPDAASRILAGAVLLLAISSVARALWTLAYTGQPQGHMLYVPPLLQPAYAVLYGVLPMLVATLLLNTVNSQLRGQLRERAMIDELTGTMTRRAVREAAPERIAEARRGRREMAVVMLDLDHFKAVNDRCGHGVGDLVLRHAARALQQHLRPDAALARYGGEEFIALVAVEDLRAARLVAERLRSAVADAHWADLMPVPLAITVSVGVTLVGPDETLDVALQRADEALYRAKRDGRNQVQVGLRAA